MASINRRLDNNVIMVMELNDNGLNIKLYDNKIKEGNEIVLDCYEDIIGGDASESDMKKFHECVDILARKSRG